MAGRERWHRGALGEVPSFDWSRPAQALRVSLDRARALYEQAVAQESYPGRRAEALYLAWLREVAAHQPRVPGRQTLVGLALNDVGGWIEPRLDGAALVPGKRTATMSAEPDAASWLQPPRIDVSPGKLVRTTTGSSATTKGPLEHGARADLRASDLEVVAGRTDVHASQPEAVSGKHPLDLWLQVAEGHARNEVVLRAMAALDADRLADAEFIPLLLASSPHQTATRNTELLHPPRAELDWLFPGGKTLTRGKPAISAWAMHAATAHSALAEVGHRRAATLLRHELAGAEVDLHDPAIAQAIERARHGDPLPAPVLQDMETRFGADFRHVRIHTDAVAARAAEALHASAFTLGEDIFFAAGAFAPSAESGQRLLVHELTHVVQSQQGRVPSSHGTEVSRPSDALEQEAAAASDRIAAHAAALHALAPASSPPLPVPRMLLRAPGPPGTHQAPGRNIAWLSWDAKLVIGFVDGLVRAGGKGIDPAARAKIERDFKDPGRLLEIYGGVQVGIGKGALQSLWDNLKGLAHVAEWVFWNLTPAGQARDTYEWLTDPAGKAAREKAKAERLKALAEGAWQLAQQIAKDSGLMADLGEELGEVAGEYVVQRVEDFAGLNPFDKGQWIGKGIGYVVMEVALLFVGPEELVAKVPAAIARLGRGGGKAAQAILRLMEKIPALRKLLQAAGRLGKAAEAVSPEAKLLAHLDQAIVKKVLQEGLKAEEIAKLAKLDRLAAEKLLRELPARKVLNLEKQLGKSELEKLTKEMTAPEIEKIANNVSASSNVWKLNPFAAGSRSRKLSDTTSPATFRSSIDSRMVLQPASKALIWERRAIKTPRRCSAP